MTSKYTYYPGIGYKMHNVERVTDGKSRDMFAEVLMEGFPPLEGALYKDEKGVLFVESVVNSYHPRECLFSADSYKRKGASLNIFAREKQGVVK